MGLTYISSVTASGSATLSFTSGIDATYNEYQFHFVNIHAATDIMKLTRLRALVTMEVKTKQLQTVTGHIST